MHAEHVPKGNLLNVVVIPGCVSVPASVGEGARGQFSTVTAAIGSSTCARGKERGEGGDWRQRGRGIMRNEIVTIIVRVRVPRGRISHDEYISRLSAFAARIFARMRLVGRVKPNGTLVSDYAKPRN